MARRIPSPPPELKEPELETWTLQLKTITPMFGGSATPRKVDDNNPIRAASVRGHLRFWWRATAGAQYPTAEALFKAEEEIWGSAKQHGLVRLKITLTNPGNKKSHSDFVNGFGDARGYALFPFAENRRENTPAACCLQDIAFSLELTCPAAFRFEVEAAVGAWVMFGGIGARTRRGCGSLELISQISTTTKTQRLHQNLLTLAPAAYLIGDKLSDPVAAWKKAVELYKEFRQGKKFARDEGSDHSKPNKLGRSRYPEPDSIRRISPNAKWRHQAKHPVQGFPRADLGLPIVFHFINEGTDHTLESTSEFGTRFASPVITKAIKVDGGYVPAILLLDAPHVWEAGDLKFEKQDKKIARAQVELTLQQRQQVSPLKGLPIREALLEFAKSKGFKEVRL
ncbi:MAG: type III-B CRISPR module RAMP protein Cmr1 [Thermaceae bacterium]|nr:type III-B CRISPR module RAMP protein Cmr1 [Thermaceae bacterium]